MCYSFTTAESFRDTSVCFQEKREQGTRLRGSPGSPRLCEQQTPIFRGGRRRGQKRGRGPFKTHSTFFSKIPSCTRSSRELSTYLAISLLLNWVRPAGGASEPFRWLCAHGPLSPIGSHVRHSALPPAHLSRRLG